MKLREAFILKLEFIAGFFSGGNFQGASDLIDMNKENRFWKSFRFYRWSIIG